MKRRASILVLVALVLGAPLPWRGQAQSAGRDVRIGVFWLFHPSVMIVTPAPDRAMRTANDKVFRAPVRLETAEGMIRCGGEAASSFEFADELGGPANFTLSIPGKISRRYYGRLKVQVVGGKLAATVSMDMETAVASVVAAESFPGTPLEALKAQAVAARSYFAAGGGRHGKIFDFCDSTHCQLLRERPADGTPAWRAANETRGLVLAYEGQVFAAMYSASCGGRTHSLQELGMPVRGYPYYPVECAYCRRHPEPWAMRLDDESNKKLAKQHTEQARLQLARSLGWNTVPANSYTIREHGGEMILSGVGHGHGLGLCQRGAADMARHGASFQQILLHYYPNTQLKPL